MAVKVAAGEQPKTQVKVKAGRRSSARAALEAEILALNEKIKRDLHELEIQADRVVPKSRQYL